MLPIVTPDEMRSIDAAALEPESALVARAGAAVARAAVRMMGGTYGRTVHVIAGKGNNGADGRVAAKLLAERGVKIVVHDAAACPASLPPCSLVIDAAYGTGFRGTWTPPDVGDTPVLAVDIASGVDALTGEAKGEVLPVTRTVTFAALKPGLLVPPGSDLTGSLEVADIGLGPIVESHARAWLVQPTDVAEWVPVHDTDAHKWRAAVRVVAGSMGMTGAARLAAEAAMRAGAGMVHLSSPGTLVPNAAPEIVQRPLMNVDWVSEALDGIERFHSMVLGPGIGRDTGTAEQVRQLAIASPVPTVLDGDALFAMAWNAQGASSLLRRRTAPTVLTPHDGEFSMLTGMSVGSDRIASCRRLAADTGCIVVLKGPATIVADPHGAVLVSTAGDARLATAGTGDVLAGVIGALLAQGVPALQAAAAGAWLHGRAAMLAPERGMVAGDLAAHLPEVLGELA